MFGLGSEAIQEVSAGFMEALGKDFVLKRMSLKLEYRLRTNFNSLISKLGV